MKMRSYDIHGATTFHLQENASTEFCLEIPISRPVGS
jgi:hypothetical protein